MKLLIEAVDGSGFKAGLTYMGGNLTLGFPARFKERAADLLDVLGVNLGASTGFIQKGWRMRLQVRIDYVSFQKGLDRLYDNSNLTIKRVKGFRRLMR